jgi:hypothetical protein
MLSKGKFVKKGVQKSNVLWTGGPWVEDDIPTIGGRKGMRKNGSIW